MKATKKRKYLADYIQTYLQEYDANYSVEQRMRRVTLNTFNRAERIKIMGDKTTYAEVMNGIPVDEGSQFDATGSPVLQAHAFIVNVWYEYTDGESYELSSQKLWDEMIVDGLLPDLSDLTRLSDEKPFIWVLNPQNVTDIIVPLDGEGKDLAHFLSFTITIR